MNNAQMSARVGLFFLMGIALIWVTFESLNGGKVANGKGYTLVAHFKNLKEIRPGDEVRVGRRVRGVHPAIVPQARTREMTRRA